MDYTPKSYGWGGDEDTAPEDVIDLEDHDIIDFPDEDDSPALEGLDAFAFGEGGGI